MNLLRAELEALRELVERKMLKAQLEHSRSGLAGQDTEALAHRNVAIALFDVILYIDSRLATLEE